MSASPHRQVWVKVNTQVKEGMAEIVFALGLSPAPDRRKLPVRFRERGMGML